MSLKCTNLSKRSNISWRWRNAFGQFAEFTFENGKNAPEIRKNRHVIVKFSLENAENVLENAKFKVEIAEFALENDKNALEIAEFTLEIANYKSEFNQPLFSVRPCPSQIASSTDGCLRNIIALRIVVIRIPAEFFNPIV